MIASNPHRKAGPFLTATVTAAAAVAVAVAFARWLELSPVDDAYISLRYAAHWAAGEGLCFNPGERVEGYTNFLMVMIEAVAIRLGASPESALSIIAFASFAGLAWVVTHFAARHVWPDNLLGAAALGLATCLQPLLTCWAASGMETTLYAFLLFTTVTLAARTGEQRPVRPVLSALCLTLAAMTRPEAAALFPATALIIRRRAGTARPAIIHGVCFIATFGLYFAARAWHFGHLFPNTFYAKLDYGGIDLIRRGLVYVGDFALAAPLLVIPCVAALKLIRPGPPWVPIFAAVIALHIAIVIYEGGDHFAMFRFIAPVLPFITLLAFFPFIHFAHRFQPHDARRTAAIYMGIAAIVISGFTVADRAKRNESPPTSQLARFQSESRTARVWSDLGRWFRNAAPPDATLATIAIGAVGYHSNLTIIDPYGLVDPVIAHEPRRPGVDIPGHDKFDTDYVLARRPSYILLVNLPTPGPARSDRLHSVVWGRFNLAMIDNPALAEHYTHRTISLPGGYLNLHVRRDLPTPVPPVPLGPRDP